MRNQHVVANMSFVNHKYLLMALAVVVAIYGLPTHIFWQIGNLGHGLVEDALFHISKLLRCINIYKGASARIGM